MRHAGKALVDGTVRRVSSRAVRGTGRSTSRWLYWEPRPVVVERAESHVSGACRSTVPKSCARRACSDEAQGWFPFAPSAATAMPCAIMDERGCELASTRRLVTGPGELLRRDGRHDPNLSQRAHRLPARAAGVADARSSLDARAARSATRRRYLRRERGRAAQRLAADAAAVGRARLLQPRRPRRACRGAA